MDRDHKSTDTTLSTHNQAGSSVSLPQSTTATQPPQSPQSPQPSLANRLGTISRWTLAVLASMWIAWCTAIGPIMRHEDGSLRDFTWVNALIFIATTAVCVGIIFGLVRFSGTLEHHASAGLPWRLFPNRHRSNTSPTNTAHTNWFSRFILRITANWRRIWLVLAIGWLWVPATLLSAYGADIRSQAREFAWAWNQWTGLEQPYIGFFSFVPMDIYPTAHYMWPTNPTYLTDQHNIVLTVIYGAAAALSRYFTGSNDAGFVFLSATQWLFAAFCIAATANRFLNMPWRNQPAKSTTTNTTTNTARLHTSGVGARIAIILFFWLCPLVIFSTISLTKSPLFAFAFTWWFGLMYEVYMTYRNGKRTRTVTIIGLIISCVVMLISAKYAWYILLAQVILSLLADRKRWKLYTGTILLPVIFIHGGISLLIHSGAIISGDPIESRGVQIQMIARVARDNPNAIPESARQKLLPIFNIDQMAAAYRSEDADPVKSSGIQSKKVSYRWRSVTEQDMENFNEAWLEIVMADPQTALDALFAKSYGYFDVFDEPYVPMSYYINNDYVQEHSTWIKHVNHDWRNTVVWTSESWSRIPVLGWLIHGNFYVVLTLLVGAAEVVLRRWRALSWHMPLLLLMGVMIIAPANNFERHMLPLAFVFGFLCIMFVRDSQRGIDDKTAQLPATLPSAMKQ